MKKSLLNQFSAQMKDNSNTVISHKGISYRYNRNTLTFERIEAGSITGRYNSLSDALKGLNCLVEEKVVAKASRIKSERIAHTPDSLIVSVLDRFSTFENALRIQFSHLYTSRS